MKNEIEINEYIEQYLTGELNTSEVEKFNKQIAEDPVFAEKVELFKKGHEVIIDGAMKNIKMDLNSIHQKQLKFNLIKKRIIGFGLGGLIIGSVIFLLTKNGDNSVTPDQKTIINEEIVEISPKIENNSNEISANEKTLITENNIKSAEPNIIDPSQNVNQNIKKSTETQSPPLQIDSLNKKDNALSGNQTPKTKQDKIIAFFSKRKAEKDKGEDKCKKLKIDAIIHGYESCNNKPTGKIIIDQQSIMGGQPPYAFSLNKTQFIDSMSFSKLNPGSYSIYARDASNCVVKVGVVWIESVNCSYPQAFAPLKGETWTAPTKKNVDGLIKIYSKSGLLVYSAKFMIGETLIWNGETTSGKQLPMGIYPFEIVYNDGTLFSSNVTIVK